MAEPKFKTEARAEILFSLNCEIRRLKAEVINERFLAGPDSVHRRGRNLAAKHLLKIYEDALANAEKLHAEYTVEPL